MNTKIIMFIALIAVTSITCFEAPPPPPGASSKKRIQAEEPEQTNRPITRKRAKELAEQSQFPLQKLPEDLQKMVFEKIIPASTSIEDAVERIKNFMFLNKKYAHYLDECMVETVTALANRWTNGDWYKAALYLGTKGVQDVIRYKLAEEELSKQQNVILEDSVEKKLYRIFKTAVAYNNLIVVKAILSLGLDVDKRFENNITPLIMASRRGYLVMVNYLLENGADPNLGAHAGISPLFASLESCSTKVFDRLLMAGANLYVTITEGQFAGYNTFLAAARYGCIEIVNRLLEDPRFSIDDRLADGRTALMIAATMGHDAVVQRLLAAGAAVDLKDTQGKTALHFAAEAGRLAIVQELLTIGKADIDSKTNDNSTALIIALKKGHPEVAKLLIEAGADFDVTNTNFDTAFLLAAERGYAEILEMLLKKGINPNKKFSISQGSDITALWSAVYFGQLPAIKTLLDRGADRRFKDAHGADLLSLGIYSPENKNKLATVDLLLTYHVGPQQDYYDSETKGSALFLAINVRDHAVVKQLIEAHANINKKISFRRLGEEDIRDDQTPLMHAIKMVDIPSIQLLLDAGADTAIKGNLGRTAYRLAQALAVTSHDDPPDVLERARRMKEIVSLLEQRGIHE